MRAFSAGAKLACSTFPSEILTSARYGELREARLSVHDDAEGKVNDETPQRSPSLI